MAEARSRFDVHLSGRDPHPERQLRGKIRMLVEPKCSQTDVGASAECDQVTFQECIQWQFAGLEALRVRPQGMIGRVVDHLVRERREGREGAAYCSVPDCPQT